MNLAITLSNQPQVYFDTATGTPSPGGTYQYNHVLAGTGDDTVQTDFGGVTVVGSSGLLNFIDAATLGSFLNEGSDSVSGGTGSLTARSGYAGGTFTGGSAGSNVFVAHEIYGNSTTMNGVAAGDEFFGSNGLSINGQSYGSGDEIMNLGAGREIVVAGSGSTTVNGGTGGSEIFAGTGSDFVQGGSAGGDTVVAGPGTTNILASHGVAVFGGTGATFVTGSTSGNDSIIGGTASLGVQGRGGNMLVSDGSGQNKIETGDGAALVFAGAGNLTLTGGAGSLQLVLGAGAAAITEGSGTTHYDLVQGSAGGSTTITDFKVGTDKIDLFGYDPASAVIASAGGSSVISFADGTKITLAGVATVGGGVFA